MKKVLLIFGILCALTVSLRARRTLDPVFPSNMVLQQDKPIFFSGTADPGKTVKADHVNYIVCVTFRGGKAELKDGMSGEVRFCSGQSKMDLRIDRIFQCGRTAWNCTKETANARYPEIRYAPRKNVNGSLRKRPASYGWEDHGSWGRCSPRTARYFSAVAYFFGRQLYKDLKIPAGLIHASAGGTRVEAWISQEGFRMAALNQKIKEYRAHAFLPAEQKAYEAEKSAEYSSAMGKDLPVFEKAGAEAKTKISDGEKPDFDDSRWEKARPVRGRDRIIWTRLRFSPPGQLPDADLKLSIGKSSDGGELSLNGKRIASFKTNDPEERKDTRLVLEKADFNTREENLPAFRGQYFYDRMSEGNIRTLMRKSALMTGEKQHPLLPRKMQTELSARFGEKGIPQLAGYGWYGPEGGWKNCDPNQSGGNPLTGDMQFQAVKDVPHTGIAPLIGIGEPGNIHPANKQEADRRPAPEAEHLVYGRNVVNRGPVFRKAALKGPALRVWFENVPTTPAARDGRESGAVAVAGKDGRFLRAKAQVRGKDRVPVSSDKVPHPVFIRYGYGSCRGECNLMNKECFSAFPFRSDAVNYAQQLACM